MVNNVKHVTHMGHQSATFIYNLYHKIKSNNAHYLLIIILKATTSNINQPLLILEKINRQTLISIIACT